MKTLRLKQNKTSGVYVEDLRTVEVESSTEMLKAVKDGMSKRFSAHPCPRKSLHKASTICSISIESTVNTIKLGKLNIVDFMGSERLSQSNV